MLNADDPLVAAMAARTSAARADLRAGRRTPTSGSATSTLDDLGRPSFDLTAGGDDRAASTLRLVGEHQADQRRGHRRDRARGGPRARRASPRACARSTGSRSGGWRCTSGPTGWSSSTTPTTPTPTRCAAALRDARPDGAARRPAHGRGAGRDARARGRAPRRSTARSGRWPHGLGHRRGRRRGRRRRGRSTTRWSPRVARTARRATSRPSNRPASGCARMCAGPDVVLVKASRAGRLERVADVLDGGRRERSTAVESDPAGRRPRPCSSPWSAPATRSGCSPAAATAS